ncbi:MAG: TIGR02391 family protein [Alphaproteobacteria bacterium]
MAFFTQDQLEAIAGALGDTDIGLTGTEIQHLLASSKMADPGPITKRIRIYNAFVESQNTKQNRTNILEFIRLSMKPARYSRQPDRYEPMRALLNQALAFAGLVVDETGNLTAAEAAQTLSEAQRRARDLRADLEGRGVHPDVLKFCRAELLADNYFHAVQEAVKSVADKMRSRTGLTDDGSTLVDRVLGCDPPLLAINSRSSVSEQSEQKGFANLVRGTFGMFRNPTAHEARIHWAMTKEDAEDLLTIVSLIHRRLDHAHMPPRA